MRLFVGGPLHGEVREVDRDVFRAPRPLGRESVFGVRAEIVDYGALRKVMVASDARDGVDPVRLADALLAAYYFPPSR